MADDLRARALEALRELFAAVRAAGEAGPAEAKAAADRMLGALDFAVRLRILDVRDAARFYDGLKVASGGLLGEAPAPDQDA